MAIAPKIPEHLFAVHGKAIEGVLRRAVRQALIGHKRARNPVAAWKDGKVVLIPPEEIPVDDDVS